MAAPETTSPGQQLYAWFIADSRMPHTHPAWERLTSRQHGIYEFWAQQMHGWAQASLRYQARPLRKDYGAHRSETTTGEEASDTVSEAVTRSQVEEIAPANPST